MKKLQDALVAIRRSPYQSIMALLVITVTFFVGYAFSIFAFGTDSILKFFETRPQVIAFFEIETETDIVEKTATKMRDKSYVTEVNVVSKQQALDFYKQDHKDNPLLLELVTADILPASIEVSGKDASSLVLIQEDLNDIKGVEDVVYQEDIVNNIQQWTAAVRGVGLAATSILGLVSFLMIVTLMNMKIAAKRKSIAVMKVIGATSWYISGPFVMEGMLYGFMGSLLGWGAMYGFLLYATPWLQSFLGVIVKFPLPFEFFAYQVGTGTLIALILGSTASMMAVRRMIKKK
ncbi:MAG: FtsX-like permease family protein [Candidatus Pacebacteria bacterium]|jgi:cell division transport system permease protein|nr:FtsX-like permease family protein [Candidatus Paceibacterota bacterium]MBT4652321.1 FtsX-like permease family protein [Candidatus Paceibacterota bacterium]MBT6756148.1 FtsX-like permease family protein [Candidatus Paceibacterota bacterium]MBT6921747.1 FtsX-like permease family protein [Candidatus Paceibacterota bacterium]